MNLYLIGYRGSGKSVVAKSLAKKLGRRHADSDERIELQAGATIQQMFARHGEEYFRKLETAVIKSFHTRDDLVVSLGGGAVLVEENRNWLRKTGQIVWLVASAQTLLRRIQSDPSTVTRRPPLTNHDALTEIQFLLAKREPLYSLSADFRLSVDHLSVEEAAETICRWWEQAYLADNRLQDDSELPS